MSFRSITDESLMPLPSFGPLVAASPCDRDLSLHFAATALNPALSGRPRGFLAVLSRRLIPTDERAMGSPASPFNVLLPLRRGSSTLNGLAGEPIALSSVGINLRERTARKPRGRPDKAGLSAVAAKCKERSRSQGEAATNGPKDGRGINDSSVMERKDIERTGKLAPQCGNGTRDCVKFTNRAQIYADIETLGFRVTRRNTQIPQDLHGGPFGP